MKRIMNTGLAVHQYELLLDANKKVIGHKELAPGKMVDLDDALADKLAKAYPDLKIVSGKLEPEKKAKAKEEADE